MQNPNIHKMIAAAASVRQVDGENWTCYCPVHESSPGAHNNSLSISAPDDGRILVNCHNGCDPREVVYAFGMTWSECFPKKNDHSANRSKITAEYDYIDDDGVLRFQVVRLEPGKDGRPKDFRQRVPDGNGGWTWKTKGLRKFPYRLPQLVASKGPVFVVEGEKQVDYLRGLGLTATCNPGGAGKWSKSYVRWFRGRDVIVIPDCDPPNPKTGKIVGAEHAKDVADSLIGEAKSVHLIELPDCQPKWGLDDWLQKGGHSLPDLQELCRNAEPWGPESSIATSASADAGGQPCDPIEYHRKILDEIGLVYCAENEDMEIEVFSSSFHKFSAIKDPGKLTYARLLQVAGPIVTAKVRQNAESSGDYSLNEVKNAIAIVAGAGRRSPEKFGQGIWRVGQQVVMVNGGHLAIYDDRKLTQELSAVQGETVFDLQQGSEWFDFDQVAGWVNRQDRKWVEEALSEVCTILEQWRFQIPDKKENPQICAEILASLIVASFIQSFWIFRPMIFLLGESNSGKSTLLQLLVGDENNPLDKGLIGALAIHSANQTAAGIRQAAERSSRPVIVDEFEQSSHRREILELLRGASRGSQAIRGTTGQKAVTTKLAFMAWAASTESGLVKQVDQNRWIKVQLVKPPRDQMGKLTIPSTDDVTRLRNKLIAASVVIGNDARLLVDALMTARPKEIDHRICQIFAVPAAVFGCMGDLPFDASLEGFRRMLSVFDEQSLEEDKDTTLDAILRSKVRCGTSERTIQQMIELADGHFNEDESLAANGIRVFTDDVTSQKSVLFHCRTVARYVVKDTDLAGTKLDELLLRLDGAERTSQRFNGRILRCVRIPIGHVVQKSQEDLWGEV